MVRAVQRKPSPSPFLSLSPARLSPTLPTLLVFSPRSRPLTRTPSGGPKDEDKSRLRHETHRLIAPRDQKHQSNFIEFRSLHQKIVYRRYAGLFFCACVDANDNELAYLEALHFFVEVLDAFFGNVCELDLVFNFYKVSGTVYGVWARKGGEG